MEECRGYDGKGASDQLEKLASKLSDIACGTSAKDVLDFNWKFLAIKKRMFDLTTTATERGIRTNESHDRIEWKSQYLDKVKKVTVHQLAVNKCADNDDMTLWDSTLHIYACLLYTSPSPRDS